MNVNLDRKRIILGAVGLVILFLVITFIASYYEYKTKGPVSEEPVSSYDEDSFKRLHEELVKDKPQDKDQKELLAEIANNEEQPKSRSFRTASEEEMVYSKEKFDTLAVNCSVLLEKYKELVIKYHELEKQVENKKQKSAKRYASSPTRTTPRKSNRARSSNGGFDYTRYVRRSGENELLNDGADNSQPTTTQFTWATLSLSRRQKVFNQSAVIFEVAEPFMLDGMNITRAARIEGVAQVSSGRGRIFINFNKIYAEDQVIPIDGEAFSLDRSRGINVFIHGENSLAESFKREATDLVGIIDPSRSQVGRSIMQGTDVGREFYGVLEAGTMILANIRRK